MTFFCDLDGTLLDVSDKFHRLYATLLEEAGHPSLSKADYWNARWQNAPTAEILARTGAGELLATFQKSWLERVETEPWMRIDQPIEGAPEALARLRQSGRVVLVTLRRDPVMLAKQLEWTGLRPLLDAVISVHGGKEPWRTKADAARRDFDGGPAWFIGDMETDILAGRALGAKTIAVCSGLRAEESLRSAKPDVILPSIAHLAACKIEDLSLLPKNNSL